MQRMLLWFIQTTNICNFSKMLKKIKKVNKKRRKFNKDIEYTLLTA